MDWSEERMVLALVKDHYNCRTSYEAALKDNRQLAESLRDEKTKVIALERELKMQIDNPPTRVADIIPFNWRVMEYTVQAECPYCSETVVLKGEGSVDIRPLKEHICSGTVYLEDTKED